MMAKALQETENLTFTEPTTGQFAIGIVALNSLREINALTVMMFEGSCRSYSIRAVERPVGQARGKIPGVRFAPEPDL